MAQLVDDVRGVKAMLEALSGVTQLAVDCEGIDLSRNGKLCIVIVGAQIRGVKKVWLVDVHVLGPLAFTNTWGAGHHTTLKTLLESPDVEKLFWDPRMDSDALWHQYGVHLKNVFCLQMAEVAHRRYVKGVRVGYVSGLLRSLGEYLPNKGASSTADKEAITRMFTENHQFWEARPLHQQAVDYCAQDVLCLFDLHQVLTARLQSSVMKLVRNISAQRTDECFTPEAHVKSRERAIAPHF